MSKEANFSPDEQAWIDQLNSTSFRERHPWFRPRTLGAGVLLLVLYAGGNKAANYVDSRRSSPHLIAHTLTIPTTTVTISSIDATREADQSCITNADQDALAAGNPGTEDYNQRRAADILSCGLQVQEQQTEFGNSGNIGK